MRVNEKCKNGRDFARWLIRAEKLQGAKNGCNLLTGQKAAKAGLGVFDGGRSGGGPIWAICRKKTAGLAAGQAAPFAEKTAGTGGWAANWGKLQKCAMPAAQKHDTQAAKSGVIQNPPKFDLRGI